MTETKHSSCTILLKPFLSTYAVIWKEFPNLDIDFGNPLPKTTLSPILISKGGDGFNNKSMGKTTHVFSNKDHWEQENLSKRLQAPD